MNTINTTAPTLSGELITIDGEAAYRIPLTGQDGLGRFALVDADGLERLREAGARHLYVVGGQKHPYVAFVRLPSHSAQMASRAIINAPQGRRVIYRNADRLDLRSSNLAIQPRKGEDPLKLNGEKAHAINQGWQAHGRQSRLQEAAWRRTAQLAERR